MTVIFRIVLWALGLLLNLASRTSRRIQSQLGRDFVFVVESRDGVARSYVFRNRRVSSHAGGTPGARCTVRFRSATVGTVILLFPRTVDRIVDGLGCGDVECDGQAAYVLWFYELTMGIVRPRQRDVWPNAYVAHDPNGKAADRITREPAVAALDPAWTAAHRQREKTMLWQVGRGGDPTGVFTRHRIVVDPVPAAAAGAGVADSAAGLAEPTA